MASFICHISSFFFFFSFSLDASKQIWSLQESNSSLLTWKGGVAYRLDLDEQSIYIYNQSSTFGLLTYLCGLLGLNFRGAPNVT